MSDAIQECRDALADVERHASRGVTFPAIVNEDALRRVLAVAEAAVAWDATLPSVADPEVWQEEDYLMRYREKHEALKRSVAALTTTTEGEKHE